MASKVSLRAAFNPTQTTITNELTTAKLDTIAAEGSSSILDTYSTDGPNGQTVSVIKCNFPPGGGASDIVRVPSNTGGTLSGSMTDVVATSWVRVLSLSGGVGANEGDTAYILFKLQTRSPVASGTVATNCATGVWQKLQTAAASGVFTASTKIEPEWKIQTNGVGAVVEIWPYGTMVEDFSGSWVDCHQTVAPGTSAVTSFIGVPRLAVWGDSIVSAGGSLNHSSGAALKNHYLPAVLAGYFGSGWDSDTDGGVSGERTDEVLTRVTAASNAIKQRVTVIWCGTNDSGTNSPAEALDNIVQMTAQLEAQNNEKYAVATCLRSSNHIVGDENYVYFSELNDLIRKRFANRCIDISTTWDDELAINPNIRADSIHPSPLGIQTIIYPFFRDWLEQKGWFENRQDGVW